jgi:NAD(P)-dependent dehydrogenase (short-subunit alcohol dehydrogenase family)
VKLRAGQVAVVTGAASGIGLALAKRFAGLGLSVVMADVEANALAAAATDVEALGAAVLTQVCDVSKHEQVSAVADATIERFGAVHVVCNNAGVGSRGLPISELPLVDFEWVVGVNLMGVVHGINAFLPHLLTQDEGHIVNTASVSGFFHLPNMAPYNATKAAVVALSETLSHELGQRSSAVGVSVLCPSWVRTNISTSQRNQPARFQYDMTPEQEAIRAAYKARRLTQTGGQTALEPEDVALQVSDAVEANQFYVITHPESYEVIEERFGRILAGRNPVEPRQ